MTAQSKPKVIVLAGCNGAGKSTASAAILDSAHLTTYINPDLIARGLAPHDPSSASMATGRFVLSHINELRKGRENFAFETTLSGMAYARLLKEMRSEGYHTQLVFLCLDHPDIAVARVAERVRDGGHDIPEPVIRRRFEGGLRNFFQVYRPIVSEWKLFNNTKEAELLPVADGEGQELKIFQPGMWNDLENRYGRR